MAFSTLFVIVCSWTLTAGLIPPTIIFPSKDFDDPDQAVAGKIFTLSCEATGSLPMTFKWKKSDKDFISFPPYQTIKSSGRSSNLTITSLNPNDDGKYQCLVSNPAGGAISRKLRLKVTAISPFVEDKSVEKTVNVTVGRPLYLACPAHTTGAGHSDFGAIHHWGIRRPVIGMQLQMKANIATLPNGDLFFTYVDQEDIKKLSVYPFNLQLQCFVESRENIYDSHIYNLKVVGNGSSSFSPTFAPGGEPMQMQTAVEGKEKFLHCVASGNPAPQTKWYRVFKNGKTKEIISDKDGIIIPKANYGRVLHIPKISKEQHEPGNYRCEVSNGQGKTLLSKLIKITAYIPPEWMVIPPRIKTINILGDGSLFCEAYGTPSPKYKWYHNGKELTSDTELAHNISMVDGNTQYGRLLIKNARNEGVYQCAAENDWGMVVSSTWLRVKTRPPKIKNFGPFYLFGNTDAVLPCNSDALPIAQHSWYKNDQLLTIGRRYSLDGHNSLVIANVMSTDEGNYTCKAKNVLGEDNASNNATFYDRTEIFRFSPNNMVITLKKALEFYCEARADKRLQPFLNYKWLKDGRPIEYDSRVHLIQNLNILRIEDANVNDGAIYTCIAFTNVPLKTEDRATAIADVKGVPSPPSNLKINGCHNRTTTITWKNERDNDAPINHFVVEQESTFFPEEWHVIVNITDPTKTSYSLQLTAWANLIFRMRAINKIGPSRASMPTPKGQCITSVFRPLMYPRNLRGLPGKAYELDIAWTTMTKLEVNGPGLHYILEYSKVLDNGQEGKIQTAVIMDPNVGIYSIPDAGHYQLWYFQITAKNVVGEGPISDIITSFSGQDAPSSIPRNVRIGDVSSHSIELSWDRVLVTRGSVDGYNIYYWGLSKLGTRSRRKGIPVEAEVFKAMSTSEDVQKQTLTGLTPYTNYALAIKAFNSGGEGRQSAEVKFVTLQDGVPSPPSNLKINGCHNRTTTITWKNERDNDAPINHFVVEQESTFFPEEWHVIVNITDPTKTSYSLQLTAWANLIFRMRAINKIGPSRASMPTPKGQCLTSVFRPLMYPRNLRGLPGKTYELDIAWTAMTKLEANGPGLHYILKYSKVLDNGQEGKIQTAVIMDPNVGIYSIPDAGHYQLWKFQITAKNVVGEGPISDIITSFSGQDAPSSIPRNVRIGDVSSHSIELSWDRVLVTRGSVDGYNIYYWGLSKLGTRSRRKGIPVEAEVFKAMSTSEDVQKQTLTGLTPYTNYALAIKAFNSGGEGRQSAEVKFVTLQDVTGPAASDFKAQAFSSYIFANWGEPAYNNGTLLGYSIGVVKHEDNEMIKPVNKVQLLDLSKNKFEHLFKDMEPETRYVIYLQAKTVTVPGHVLKADVKTIAPAKPTKPRAPLAVAHSTTAVNITFLVGETAGGYPLEFMVKYRGKSANESFNETGWFDHLKKRWTMVENLAKNRLYQFITVSRNKLGSSPDSPSTDTRPLHVVPAAVSGTREDIPFYRAPWFIILIFLNIYWVACDSPF